jgi:hypothetical protein
MAMDSDYPDKDLMEKALKLSLTSTYNLHLLGRSAIRTAIKGLSP